MFVLYGKDEEPYVYQDTLFLGVYSTIERAKEQMYIYNSNLKLQKLNFQIRVIVKAMRTNVATFARAGQKIVRIKNE